MNNGPALARLRASAGMSQEQLAQRLHVSRETVSKWETNARRYDRRTAGEIAALLGADIGELYEENEEILYELSGCVPRTCALKDEELYAALNVFLRTLKEKDRGIFVRRYYFSESAGEIGAIYGITEGAVRTALTRMRKKYRKYLEGK